VQVSRALRVLRKALPAWSSPTEHVLALRAHEYDVRETVKWREGQVAFLQEVGLPMTAAEAMAEDAAQESSSPRRDNVTAIPENDGSERVVASDITMYESEGAGAGATVADTSVAAEEEGSPGTGDATPVLAGEVGNGFASSREAVEEGRDQGLGLNAAQGLRNLGGSGDEGGTMPNASANEGVSVAAAAEGHAATEPEQARGSQLSDTLAAIEARLGDGTAEERFAARLRAMEEQLLAKQSRQQESIQEHLLVLERQLAAHDGEIRLATKVDYLSAVVAAKDLEVGD